MGWVWSQGWWHPYGILKLVLTMSSKFLLSGNWTLIISVLMSSNNRLFYNINMTTRCIVCNSEVCKPCPQESYRCEPFQQISHMIMIWKNEIKERPCRVYKSGHGHGPSQWAMLSLHVYCLFGELHCFFYLGRGFDMSFVQWIGDNYWKA